MNLPEKSGGFLKRLFYYIKIKYMETLNDKFAYKIAYKMAISLLTEGLLSKNENIDLLDICNILKEIALDYEEEIKK
jgi:hypothetical protein